MINKAATEKETVRSRVLGMMNRLPGARILQEDKKILDHLTASSVLEQSPSVFCFASQEKEFNTWPLLAYCLQHGKELAVPRCEARDMTARTLPDLISLDRLRNGNYEVFYGIMQPGSSFPVMHEPQLCIVPCVACDPDGYRLGYGGGYYDRYLRMHPDMKTVAVCRTCQIIEHVPRDIWDLPVQYLCTSTGLWKLPEEREKLCGSIRN